MRSTDSTGKIISEGRTDSVAYTIRYDADSMIATSVAYTDPTLPKGTPQVMFRSVGRLKEGKLVGTSALMVSPPYRREAALAVASLTAQIQARNAGRIDKTSGRPNQSSR